MKCQKGKVGMMRRPHNDPSSGRPHNRREMVDRLVLRATLAAQSWEPLDDVAQDLSDMAGRNRTILELARRRLEERASAFPSDQAAKKALKAIAATLGAD
jgi:hypothetical protein